jgi:molybdate transport system regulatory protein
MNKIQVRSKVWLEYAGHPFLGDGRLNLLDAINKSGSINAAAKMLGISYRKAWAQLQDMEKHSPFPLLKRRVGGSGGGQTLLTEKAQALLEKFSTLCHEIKLSADLIFSETFPEIEN